MALARHAKVQLAQIIGAARKRLLDYFKIMHSAKRRGFGFGCLVTMVLLSALPAGAETPQQPAAQIDAILQKHWKAHNLPPTAPASDEVFLRRVFLDVAGRIPTVAEARNFLADPRSDKRALLIARLLDGETYSAAFYPFWADLLRLIDVQPNTQGVSNAAYERYVKESLRNNKPYDQFVRELLSAKGQAFEDGAVGYYLRDRGMPLDNMAVTTHVFLGTRIECAQCHDHPFDKWKQTDFYKMAAFTYGNEDRKFLNRLKFPEAMDASQELARADKDRRLNASLSAYYNVVGQPLESTEIHRSTKEIRLPHDFKESDGRPHEVVSPAPLYGPVADDPGLEDRAEKLARWVTAAENPRFTRVIVNRLWKKLFGAPLTDAYDALTDESKSAMPELEGYLERLMAGGGYDMKAFLGSLLNTRAYQSVAARDEYSPGSLPQFQGPYLRRMTPEQIWDSFVALVSHEPDSRNGAREAMLQSKIRTAKTASDAYEAMGAKRVLDLALARIDEDKQFTEQRAQLMMQMEKAAREGDQTGVQSLKKAVFSLEAQWEKQRADTIVMPILDNLAKQRGGQAATPTLDELFSVPSYDYIRARYVFTQFYMPGDALAPASKEQVRFEEEKRRSDWHTLADRLEIPENERAAFERHCQATMKKWVRAAEVGNPAPRGHFLREMGQSDRELVENANMKAGMPQALLLMNGEITSSKGLLSKFSPLMLHVRRASDPEILEAVCFALFSRKPTAGESDAWQQAKRQGVSSVQDVVFALLNTPQFIFIE